MKKMEHQKVYTGISIALGAVFFFSLCNHILYLFRSSFLNFTNLLYTIPLIIGITGLLLFLTSGYKKSGLLRMFMCYQVFGFPFLIFYYYNMLFNWPENLRGLSLANSWQFYTGIFSALILFASSVIGLWYTGKRRLPKITYFGQDENKVGQFVPASGGLRFVNRLIDGAIITYTVFWGLSGYFSIRNYSLNNSYDITDSPVLLYLIEIPAIVIYYLLLEGIFNTTAGKSATNTTIVNDGGEKPGFAKIAGRTFCRIIPFDALSFLGAGARGWHDSIPNTYVVESIDVGDVHEHEIILDAEKDLQQQ